MTLHIVDALLVLTFGVNARLKSNTAPTQLKVTQKILSNNCGCTVTLRTVGVLQFVVLIFGVNAKLKSNVAPAQLKVTQKILSNNCGCISQCIRTNYCEILQILLPHVYSIISLKEQ